MAVCGTVWRLSLFIQFILLSRESSTMVESVPSLRWILVAIVHVLIGLSSGASVKQRNCQCVPDQWQGILASEDREFDLTGGRTGHSQTYLYITYDFLNKKFAMTDLNSGNRAIADYNRVSSVSGFWAARLKVEPLLCFLSHPAYRPC